MSGSRELRPLPVPAGPTVLELLDPLRRALAGEGPALLPVPAGEPAEARRLADALVAGQPLGDTEDAPDNPTALVLATSGSTGESRGVVLPAGALRASATATHARLGAPGQWLLALPAWHVAGIQVLIRSLLAGTTPGVVDLAESFRPGGFARSAAPVLARPGPHYTSLVPTQLARLLEAGGPGLAALCAFDAVLLGGAATPPALLARALDAGVPAVTTYGASETAGGCVYDGVPLDGVTVRLTGPRDEPGRVELAGPVLARGYRLRPEHTAATFVAGWFRAGDLGHITADGRLEILGRVDDLINTGGVKIPPVRVERVLAAQPGVLEACVVGIPDPEWGETVVAAVVPVDPAAPPAEDALREAVRAQVGRAAVPTRLRMVAELPLRGPGKVDRRAVCAAFTEGAPTVAAGDAG